YVFLHYQFAVTQRDGATDTGQIDDVSVQGRVERRAQRAWTAVIGRAGDVEGGCGGNLCRQSSEEEERVEWFDGFHVTRFSRIGLVVVLILVRVGDAIRQSLTTVFLHQSNDRESDAN